MKKLILLFVVITIIQSISAQVKIGNNPNAINNSAVFELETTDKGFLAPRLTTTQRDAIVSPAEGLVIYNITTQCINYRTNNQWSEICGNCAPQPTTSNAGTDQLGLSGTTANLNATSPQNGSGIWTIISGAGGSFSGNPTSANPTATFSGVAGTTYVLRWTITNNCGSSQDDVTISFQSNSCNPPGTILIASSEWCDPNPPSGWTQCAGWINTGDDDVSNTVLNGCLNGNNRLRIKVWNNSTGTLEEDVYSTNANVSSWPSWDYLGGTVTRATFTYWTGTTTYFVANGGGSACYFNSDCGFDAPCGTLTLGTGNGSSVILAPGATNGFEYRVNCQGQSLVNRRIAVYK
jgi:hypothetical protein